MLGMKDKKEKAAAAAAERKVCLALKTNEWDKMKLSSGAPLVIIVAVAPKRVSFGPTIVLLYASRAMTNWLYHTMSHSSEYFNVASTLAATTTHQSHTHMRTQ